MASTPEKRVKEKVVAVLKQAGAYYFFPATHGYGRSGVPDIVACVNGRFIGIECKAGKNKPTALQEREINQIQVANGIALVVNEENWDMLPGLIQNIKSGTVMGEQGHD